MLARLFGQLGGFGIVVALGEVSEQEFFGVTRAGCLRRLAGRGMAFEMGGLTQSFLQRALMDNEIHSRSYRVFGRTQDGHCRCRIVGVTEK